MASKRDIVRELKRLKEVAWENKDKENRKNLHEFEEKTISIYDKEIEELREAINKVVEIHADLKEKLCDDKVINGSYLRGAVDLTKYSGTSSDEIKRNLIWNANFHMGESSILENKLNKELSELSKEWENLIANVESMRSSDATEYLSNLGIDISYLDNKCGCVAIMAPVNASKLGLSKE